MILIELDGNFDERVRCPRLSRSPSFHQVLSRSSRFASAVCQGNQGLMNRNETGRKCLYVNVALVIIQ